MGRKIILVGCGNMGYAMLKGWLAAGKLAPNDVFIVEPDGRLRSRAASHGVNAVATAKDLEQFQEKWTPVRPELPETKNLDPFGVSMKRGIDLEADAVDLVIFAVKPQMIRDVAPAYRRFMPAATFLSVAAGTGVATFEEVLGSEAAILRCMPNTPASIGEGMMVLFANSHVRPEVKEFVRDLLSANGTVTTIEDEALMDAVTAISGSGPAYLFHFIECLTAAGEDAGLPADTAQLLAMQTVYGAAALAKKSGEDPATLREQVTSPGGTTAAALSILMGGERLKELMREAVAAAKKRSIELGA